MRAGSWVSVSMTPSILTKKGRKLQENQNDADADMKPEITVGNIVM